ncbi:MAG TPA: MBG domain-containing protein [Opitutaceae bacterium]|nr:MBG domain-containing protein [Opitutaceae bacterium]
MASGDAPLSYQWLKNDVEIAGATTATLTITNAQAGDAATYTVMVSNAVGSVTSSGADLVISGLPPGIVDQPVSRTVAAGATATFAVTASGSPPFTYQWRKAGLDLTDGGNVSGATTPVLTLQNVQSGDMGAYDVVVSNTVSSATSAAAVLTITPAAPTITSQPVARSLAPGSTATFTVVASGTAPLSYQWRKDGIAISGNPSAGTATLTLTGISAADAGSYDVLVTNSVDSVVSNAVALSITSASATQIFYTGGSYTQDFDSLPSSGTYTFSGVGPFSLNSAPVGASNLGGWSFGKAAGTGANALFLVGTGSLATGGTYSFGSSGSADRALGSLASGSVVSRFGATFVNNTGQTITGFTLSYTGEQWRHGGAATPNTLSFSYAVGAADIGAGSFVAAPQFNFVGLSTSSTSGALDGNAAANRATVSGSVTGLDWAPGQTLVIRWTDVDDSGSDDGLAIDNVAFSTAVVGPTGPSVAATTPGNSATNVALNTTIAVTFDQAVNATGSSFVIHSAKRGAIAASVSASTDGRTYTLTPPLNFDFSDHVSVTVLAGGITSQSTGLHPATDYGFAFTTADPVAPTITTPPVSQTAAAGSTVSFTVSASGTAPFTYQWRKDGAPIVGNPSAGAATLVLTNVQAGDTGNYDVVVANGVNPTAVSSTASLVVNPAAPTIVTAPASQTVKEGANVTFSVVATGTMPFSYQWQRDGVTVTESATVSGTTTATLSIAPAAVGDGGSYTVVVTNGVGSPVTSAAAVLVVKPLPKPFTAGNIVVVRVGSGAGSLVSSGNPVFLDEFTPDGALVQSIEVPSAADGNNEPLILGGTATTEGGLTRSADRRFLALAGYATVPGGPSLSGTTSTAVNRVIARIGINATIDTTTVLTDWASSTSPRSAVTVDGASFWLAGGNGGIRLASLGASNSSSVSTTVTNLRVVDIYAGQLYTSTQSGSALRIASVGTGLPTGSGETMTGLPGLPTTGSPNAFFFADLDPTVAGVDTLYVADESSTGGILKYSLVGGSWIANGKITAASVRGVTGTTTAGTVTLFATTGASSAAGGGTLFRFVDATGYNGAVSGSASAIATAGANTAFRGVALAPGSAPVITAQPVSQSATYGGSVSFTVTATASGTLSYQWRKGGVPLVDGGTVSGASTATLTVSGISATDAGDYDVIVTNPIDSVTSTVATLDYQKAPATIALGALTATYDGAPHSATTTTTPAGLNVVVTYDGGSSVPVNTGSYAVAATIDDVNFAGSATGTLVIAPAAATVTLGDLVHIYSGAPCSASATTSPAGLAVAITYAGSTVPPAAAGSYPVVATITDANYVGSTNGTLVIEKAPAAVTLGGLAAVYDGMPHGATVTTVPAGLSVTLTYDGNAAPPVNAGSHAVVATIADANYFGTGSGTLVISPAVATITLAGLVQTYDGTPRVVTATTVPADLPVVITYDGAAAAPTAPGSYAVVATIHDPNHAGSATGTLLVSTTALVRHAPTLNGGVDGSIQVELPESVTLNGQAWVSGDLLVPGTPTVRLNGRPTYAGTLDGSGAATPSNFTVTLNGDSVLRHVVRRTPAVVMPVVPPPPAPTGTRTVVLNSPTDNPGNFATIRNLTLNGRVGACVVPAGTYGTLIANGNSGFVLGTPGATTPATYNLQGLVLNGNCTLQVVGPVILNLATGVTVNGNMGDSGHPEWLVINVASGGVTLNGGVTISGLVTAPAGTVIINGHSTLTGALISDRLIINGNGQLNPVE